jgi:AraC family transcriptional regulator, regulatory protein of adaptative response / methylated-DNA-[protein]-cysteine methyltransferase
MEPNDFSHQSDNYRRIEKAIQFIEKNYKTRPNLDRIAASAHLSRHHFDRVFKRWAGISPIHFMQYLSLDYTKQKLAESRSLLDTSLDAGFSGPGRLHDLFVTLEALSPGEYKKQGAGLDIAYGFSDTPFGECLLAVTGRGICHLGFVTDEQRSTALDQLFQRLPNATFTNKFSQTNPIVKNIFSPGHPKAAGPFNLHLKGTNFQVNVWKALLRIPEGWVVSYRNIAAFLGRPKAFRAVARAVALNPIGYLIPCHRVIAKSGKIHQYRWGSARKKALLGWEAARTRTTSKGS